MTLTAKQQAQVAKAPQARKAALTAMFKQQNSGTTNKQRTQTTRNQPRAPLARKALAVPKPMGYAFDGFDKRHLPLDEKTAPYTTSNFINVMSFATKHNEDQIIVVGLRTQYAQEVWAGALTDYIAMLYNAAHTNDPTLVAADTVRTPLLGDRVQIGSTQRFSVRGRLHNLSVRLQCLGTNTGLYPPGVCYVGTVPSLEIGYHNLPNNASLKDAWANDSIEVGYLKPVSAASLIDKPVCLDASVTEAITYKTWNDFMVPPSSANIGSFPLSQGMTPIMIYIPRCGTEQTQVEYKIEIAQQWCTRHPFNVMMRATQKQHEPSHSTEWTKALNNVKDIGQHLLERAGNVALDVLANRMNQAYTTPANAIQFVD